METLKKYWWVGLIVVIALVWFFWDMNKNNTDAGCKTTKAAWDAKLAEVELSIDNLPEWKAQVEAKVQETGESYEVRRKKSAEWYMTKHDKMCKPATAA